VSAGKRRLAAIATTIPVAGPRTSEPLSDRLGNIFAHWHDHIFGPENDGDFYSMLFSRTAALGALALILLAAALPSHGAGVPICLFRYLTGLPCPGCGLTRSFSCILHGEFERGYEYHPFGYFLLPLFLLAASTLFLPASYHARLEDFVRARQSHLRRIYLTLIYGFITFGTLRIAVYALQGLHAL
jgi:hypothetical protein